MRNPKTVLSIIAAMALLAATTVASAGGWGGCSGHDGAMGYRHGAWLSKLDNLTKEQKGQFDKLHNEFMKRIEALRSQKAQKRIELAELATKSPQDEAAIQKKKEEIWALKDQMRKEGRALGTSIRSLLTPEQREKLGVWTGPGHGFSGHRRGMM